jgi:high-affinity iron transporter
MIFTISERKARCAAIWVLVLLFARASAAAPPPRVEPGSALRAVVESYTPERSYAAKQEAADAFFSFEGSALDRDLAVRDPGLYRELEGEWMRLLSAMDGARPASEVRARGERVLALLERGTVAADAGGSVFFDALLIILREGFEAILIVSALAAYLSRTGHRARIPYLYGGALLAVGASIAMWFAARSVIELGGARREALEGWTVLLASGVLFWVSYWLISKAEATRWQAFVKSQVERAVGRGALLGLGALSFVVVFREGLETVLFYEAVAARVTDATGHSLLVGGFLTGCTALCLLYVAFQRVGGRIPLRAFFNVTGGLLYFMAFRFAGAGVRELQEAGIVRQTPVHFMPDSVALSQWLGISPYVEPLLLQGLLLGLALFGFAYASRSDRGTVPSAPRETGGSQAIAGRG